MALLEPRLMERVAGDELCLAPRVAWEEEVHLPGVLCVVADLPCVEARHVVGRVEHQLDKPLQVGLIQVG